LNIGILSGKGGTGKTFLSTNLAHILGANYVDCDVEEPNGFIFLNPTGIKTFEVKVDYPVIDKSKCTMCGECVKVCQFNALAKVKNNILLFEKLCHACGACEVICKFNALSYKKRTMGVIEEGKHNNAICKRGVLNIGEPMAVSVIDQLLENLNDGVNIIDCAPGTSRNVVNSLDYVDAAILVTEPTEFGFHDLKLAAKLIRTFNKPLAVVINKYVEGEEKIHQYCTDENIPILGVIPYKREVAKIYSKGEMISDIDEYRDIFMNIANEVKAVFVWS